MKTLNHLFSTEKRFLSFLSQNNVDTKLEYFVQVFIGDNNPEKLQDTLNIIKSSLPNASILATSTAGEIAEGGMQDNTTVVSITSFEFTNVNVALFEEDSELEAANKVIETMIKPETKLLLVFNNVYANDGEDFLSALEKKTQNITIAGGNAGDNGNFAFQTVVGVNTNISTTGIAVATFDSEILQVFNEYLFNWQRIGEIFTVTKADGSTIYEIDNLKAQEIYKQFLGNEIAENLPSSGVEFPLLFNENGIDIARAPVAIGEDGELIMAGHIKEGSRVQFGFGDVSTNNMKTQKAVQEFSQNPIETIFIYSCSARKYALKENLNTEFEFLQQIAPTSGFITYGEFFSKNECNSMFNVSSTFIGLSENKSILHNLQIQNSFNTTQTQSALIHLVQETSKRLEERNNKLKQLQNLVHSSTIYSSTDLKGNITDVNEEFEKISGYTKDELIGKQHNIVRHPDMPSETFKEMWQALKEKNSWNGIVKNRAKDGSSYYVQSHIFPILDTNNNTLEYVSIRNDITEEMRRKEHLEGEIKYLETKSKEEEYLLQQYENILNLSTVFFRIDTTLNITHVNDVFSTIFEYPKEAIIDRNLAEILEPSFFYNEFDTHFNELIEKGTWSGTIPFIKNDDTIIYMNTSANTIYDQNNELMEVMIVLYDITDLVIAQKEIEDTQRDVVYTMGAIGETRSKETGNHVKRVAEYSRILALKYGLSEKESNLLKMASPMHDIGKVGIPDSILNKPGKLTNDEWKIMKTHAKLGYSMLKNSKREILQTAALVALTHHEKWDGSGYPSKLHGEHIHIYGRITALADVFDALGSDRVYKKAWEDEKIFQLIKDESGKHFDPDLVKIFFNNLDLFLEVRSEFP